MKVMNGLVMTLEDDKRFLCVWLFYYVSNFADSRMKVPRYRSSPTSLLHEIIFPLSVFSSSEVLGRITSIQSKHLRKKREETVKPTCFSLLYVESDKSFQQYSLPVEALNSIVDSKSQPFEAKEKLAIIFK